MVQYSNFDRIVEAQNHFKNEASSKSCMINGNVIRSITALFFLFLPFTLWGQVKVSYKHAENQELMDYFRLEGIQYMKLSFTGKELENKTYQMWVKEIWDGEIKMESPIVISSAMQGNRKTVGDSTLNIRIVSKLTADNKLNMDFHFPSFSTSRSFDATSSNIYSLRSAMGTDTIKIGKKSYILVYMLPYEKEIGNGSVIRQYCAVEDSGKEIETWGKEFGIKHYLVFEMKFE